MEKTAFSTPQSPSISFGEYLTIMKTQTAYTLKYTRYMIETAKRNAAEKIRKAFNTYKELLDDGDEDVIDMSAKEFCKVAVIGLAVAFALCFTF